MNNKRGTGAIFCLTAGILFSARYIAAAVFMSGVTRRNAELFKVGLEYVGSPMLILSIISMVVGIAYLIAGELEDRRGK